MAQTNDRISLHEFWSQYKNEALFAIILSALVALGHWLSRFIPLALLFDIILPIQHGGIISICALGAFLLFTHSDGVRARKASAWALLVWGVADSSILVQDYLMQFPILRIGSDALDAYVMLIGNFLAWVLLIYPTETLRPGWLNWKRGILQLLPMVLLVALDYFVQIDLRWLVMLYPLALVIMVVVHIRKYRKWCEENYSSMDHIDAQWLVRYLSMVLIMGGSYLYICFSDNPGRVVTQNAFLFFLFCYSIEQILFREDPWQNMQSNEEQSDKDSLPDAAARLTEWMVQAKPYLNPDLRLMDLREVLPMNRTYLSQFIHDEFDCSFFQFVNRYRIEEARRLLREEPSLTIEQVALRSGFSSRVSFTRVFTNETGLSPREWSAQCNISSNS
jgi:AraC-like DNA-binding protein